MSGEMTNVNKILVGKQKGKSGMIGFEMGLEEIEYVMCKLN